MNIELHRFAPVVASALLLSGSAMASTRPHADKFAARLERAFFSDPRLSGTYDAFKTGFPKDWKLFIQKLSNLADNGATQNKLSAAAAEYFQKFISYHLSDIANSPSHRLQQYRQDNWSLIHLLSSTGISLCAKVAMGDVDAETSLPKPAVGYLMKISESLVRAASEGKLSPVPRNAKDLTNEDAKAFIRAMRHAGATVKDLSVFGDSQTFAAAPSDQKCRIGLAIQDGLAELPLEQADRVTAFIIVITRS